MRAALLGALVLASCASSIDWRAMTTDTKQLTLGQITERCGMPSDRLQSDGADGVIFNLQPTDEYQRVDCLLAEMKKLRGIKLGFIGNEQYEENSQ